MRVFKNQIISLAVTFSIYFGTVIILFGKFFPNLGFPIQLLLCVYAFALGVTVAYVVEQNSREKK